MIFSLVLWNLHFYSPDDGLKQPKLRNQIIVLKQIGLCLPPSISVIEVFFHIIDFLPVHLSSLVNSSEPRKQFGIPSHNFDNSNNCKTSVDSLTWHPKYPSSKFKKNTSRLIPNPIPPKDWAVWKKKKRWIFIKIIVFSAWRHNNSSL